MAADNRHEQSKPGNGLRDFKDVMVRGQGEGGLEADVGRDGLWRVWMVNSRAGCWRSSIEFGTSSYDSI